MKSEIAQCLINGLEQPQKTRMHSYYSWLTKDRDNRIFDDKIRDCIVSIAKPHMLDNIISEIAYLDGIGFCQSKYEWSKIVEQVERFALPEVSPFTWNKNYKFAVQKLKSILKPEYKLSAFQDYRNLEIEKLLPKLDTHSGFMFFETGCRTKGENIEEIALRVENVLKQTPFPHTFGRPIVPATRTQASGAYDHEEKRTNSWKAKSRLVSVVDSLQISMECLFARPIQQYLSYTKWYAGGKNDSDIRALIQNMYMELPYGVTFDYSHYDQSIPSWLIRDCFEIIRDMFMMDEVEEKIFSTVVNDFINKVFLMPDATLVESHKGVPSGSMFTQIIDSMANYIMITAYMHSIGIRDNDYDMLIMGDDNIVFCNEQLNVHSVETYLDRNFGIEMNAAKVTTFNARVDVAPSFLSRDWHASGNYRNWKELIGKMCFPERFRQYPVRSDYPMMAFEIIASYYDTFPLGMFKIIDMNELERKLGRRYTDVVSGEYLTGLMKYRRDYLSL